MPLIIAGNFIDYSEEQLNEIVNSYRVHFEPDQKYPVKAFWKDDMYTDGKLIHKINITKNGYDILFTP